MVIRKYIFIKQVSLFLKDENLEGADLYFHNQIKKEIKIMKLFTFIY
jgi:hypothetical protein